MFRYPQRAVALVLLILAPWLAMGCESVAGDGSDPGSPADPDATIVTPDPGTDPAPEILSDLADAPDPGSTDSGTPDTRDPGECVPDCGDRDCGDDGCGDVCGTCTDPGETCQEGTCTVVGFDLVNTRVFQTWCRSCHTGPTSTSPVSYPYFVDNHDETLLAATQGGTVADRILYRAVTVKTMPPGPPLSAQNQDLLSLWVEGGAGP